MGSKVKIKALSSGYVVTERKDPTVFDGFKQYPRTTAEPTLQGALTLAARALGYRGVIRFDDEPRTVEVPVKIVSRADFEAEAMRAMCPDYTLPEGPILTQAYGLGPGPAVDDEEPPLRAGTAKPGDKL